MNPPSLKEEYKKVIAPKLIEKFGYPNIFAVPRLKKAVVNVGTSQALKDQKYFETIDTTMARITGQKAISCVAKKSIATFKIRKGLIVGKKVTLRGGKMYDFVEKLVRVVLPRLRDFRGIPLSALDKDGNLTIGFPEHIVFPEIRPDEIERIHGLEATVVTQAKSREEALELLKLIGFPFQKY
jgi:large subunit ribosomal protein L5